MPDLSTIDKIRIKIRRLTRSPSASQITENDIDDYINNFILYDFAAIIRSNILETVLTFYTSPNVEKYSTDTINVNDPLYNFKNKYLNSGNPTYIAGIQTSFTESRDYFYGVYPLTNFKINIGTGNAVTALYNGTLSNVPVISGNVSISSVDINGNRLLVTDDGDGNLTGDTGAASTINYETGVYSVTFSSFVANQETIWAQTVPYKASRPDSILFFQDEFILRPIPDATYRVDVSVYKRPSALGVANTIPELAEWHEYISYGAAIKILQDRLDMDTVNIIMPEFKRQEVLIMRRKIIQNSGKRTATIFNQIRTGNNSYFNGDL